MRDGETASGPVESPRLELSGDDFLSFIEVELGAMMAIVEELGDDLANRRLPAPGSNSPYAILTHCLGVMEYWAGGVVAGRAIQRNREAEFVATGKVGGLLERAGSARAQLRADLAGMDPVEPPRGDPGRADRHSHVARTQAGAAQHVYEELARHRGQMEVTRDALLFGRGSG